MEKEKNVKASAQEASQEDSLAEEASLSLEMRNPKL